MENYNSRDFIYKAAEKFLNGASATDALEGLESFDPNETEAFTPNQLILFEILKRRARIFQLIELYYVRCKYAKRNIPRLENALMSQIFSLYCQLKASMSIDKNYAEKYPTVERLINSHQIENHISAYSNYIEPWMYGKGITKFDNKAVFKIKSAEEQNQFKRL